MKYVKVPEPIQVLNLVTGTPVAEPIQETGDDETVVVKRDKYGEPVLKLCKPWSFYEILTRFVFNDKSHGLKGKSLAKFMRRLTKGFKNAKPSEVVVVDDADLEALKKVGDSNEWGTINGQLGDFWDSIDEASDEDPRKPKTE